MPYPRTVLASSGALSFGNINAAIEWSSNRANTAMRGNGFFGDVSLVASWNATLDIFLSVTDYGGYATYYHYSTGYETIPDSLVDTTVTITSSYYYIYDPYLNTQTVVYVGTDYIYGNSYFSSGGTSFYDIYCYDQINFPCYVTGLTFTGSVSPASSGNFLNESAGYAVSEFYGKQRYRSYNANCSLC